MRRGVVGRGEAQGAFPAAALGNRVADDGVEPGGDFGGQAQTGGVLDEFGEGLLEDVHRLAFVAGHAAGNAGGEVLVAVVQGVEGAHITTDIGREEVCVGAVVVLR